MSGLALGRAAGAILILALAAVGAGATGADDEAGAPGQTTLDLATVLRVAGAQNLDVQLARQRLAEARAIHRRTVEQFFPWLSAGLSYRRHDGLTQSTEGSIVDVHKHGYAPGATVAAEADLGHTVFRSRETKGLSEAAEHGLDARRADSLLLAVQSYFELARAQAAVGVARDALDVSRDYEEQLHRAVEVGLAFKGDELHVRAQTRRSEVALRQAAELRRVAAARLAQVLHLDPAVDRTVPDEDLVPLPLVDASASLDSLMEKALASRPEVRSAEARVAAARAGRDAAVYGPILPLLGAQVFLGGLGGGRRGAPDEFGGSRDYALTLSWRIGPGGLLDGGRTAEARARLESELLLLEKARQDVVREVVEGVEKVRSLSEQLTATKEQASAATEALRLSRERREFGVASVLESILAAQDLTRARADYIAVVAEYDKAQYALLRATGRPEAMEAATADRAPR